MSSYVPAQPTSQGEAQASSTGVAVHIAAFVMLALVTWLDLVTGIEISVSIFYVAPIVWLTWRRGRMPGLVLAFLSGLAWWGAERYGGQHYSHALIPIWNAAVRLAFFAGSVEAIHRLRIALLAAESSARRDPLTGLGNSRAFREAAEMELARCRRYGGALSIVYIDVDSFKQVNDKLGHATGDRVLQSVGQILRENLRQVDISARLGGDEFAILLPESDASAARMAMEKLRGRFARRAKAADWPISLSIGIAAFRSPPSTVDLLIRAADAVMYTVKHQGKDGIGLRSFDPADQAASADADSECTAAASEVA